MGQVAKGNNLGQLSLRDCLLIVLALDSCALFTVRYIASRLQLLAEDFAAELQPACVELLRQPGDGVNQPLIAELEQLKCSGLVDDDGQSLRLTALGLSAATEPCGRISRDFMAVLESREVSIQMPAGK